MFCENCGAKIADNDMFCQNCGKRIELPAAQPAPEQSVNQAEPETSVQESEQTVQSEEIPAQQVTTAVAEPQQQQANPYAQQAQQQQANLYAQQAQQQQANPYAQQVQQPQANPYAQQAQQSQANPYAQQVQQPQTNPYAPQNPYSIQNGQQQVMQQPKKSNFKISKKMIIIGSAILAVVIVAVIVICILVSNANNPVNKMINAINDGDYKTAEELYYNNYSALSDNKAVIDAIQAQVDAVEKGYKDGSIDYNTAMNKLDDISDLPMSYETTLSDVKSEMYELKSSADSLKKGDKYLKDKDYDNAIYYYGEVLEKDTANYKKAQEQKAKAVDGIRQKYLDEAKKDFDNGDYKYAISDLQDALNNTYLDNDKKINEQIATYVDEIIKKSDEYFNNKDYENAVNLIDNTKNMFSEDSDNRKKLDTQLEKLNQEVPVKLSDIKFDSSNTDYFYRYQSGSKDVAGNEYNGDNVCTMSVSKYHENAYAGLYVNKDYKKIKGTVAVEKNNYSDIGSNTKAYFEIVGDNKTLYKSEVLTNKSEPINFEVNIKNVEKLTIELVYVKNSGNSSMDVILADVELYSKDSSVSDASANETSEVSKAESSKEENSKTASKPETSKPESSKAESSKAA